MYLVGLFLACLQEQPLRHTSLIDTVVDTAIPIHFVAFKDPDTRMCLQRNSSSISAECLDSLKRRRGCVQAVTTAVALEFGLGSSLFAVALCFTVITMYDAAGVRRHAGTADQLPFCTCQSWTKTWSHWLVTPRAFQHRSKFKCHVCSPLININDMPS